MIFYPHIFAGRPGPLAALALALGCGPGDSQTTTASTDPSTGPLTEAQTDSSTADSSTAEPTTSPDSSTGSSTGALTDSSTAEPTTGDPATCADLCQRTVDCGVPLALDACIDECQVTEGTLQTCLLACDQPVCDDLLHCTTVCSHTGDPNAEPYAVCGENASTCLPDVYFCEEAVWDGEQFSVCAPFCDVDDPCPVPTTGNAPPQCDLQSRPSTCTLDCTGGQQCPDDMVCDIKSGICSHLLP